jgi:hypothetical protein
MFARCCETRRIEQVANTYFTPHTTSELLFFFLFRALPYIGAVNVCIHSHDVHVIKSMIS